MASADDNVCRDIRALAISGLYVYQPLKGERSIRLLRLAGCHNGETKAGKVVDCEIVEVELSSSSSQPLEYEAISYTWGKPPFTGKLETASGSIQIPENLANALRQLTPPPKKDGPPRYLWADAVCIDQANTSERSAQVGIMGDIFQRAVRVLVWLGLGDENTGHVFTLFTELSSMAGEYGVDRKGLIENNNNDIGGNAWEGSPITDAQRRRLDNIAADHDFRGTDEFYSNPWFSRLWIVQETALARELRIHCGVHELAWNDFLTAAMIQRRAVSESTYSSWRLPYGFQAAMTVFRARALHQKSFPAILMLHLGLLRQNQCSLDVDRIYALLNLRGPMDPKIRPDYTKSVRQVYVSTMEALLQVQVQTLAYAGLAPRLYNMPKDRAGNIDTDDISQLEGLCAELPSWVADWRVTTRSIPSFAFSNKELYSAATGVDGRMGRYPAHVVERLYPGIASPESIVDLDVMSVDGILAERSLSDVDFDDLELVRERLLEIKNFYDSHRDRILLGTNGEDLLSLFAKTIMANGTLNDTSAFIRRPLSTQDLVDLWRQFEKTPYVHADATTRRFEIDPESSEPREALYGGTLHALSELYAYRLALREAVRNRTFFITRQGYVGLAPDLVRKGDVVVLVAGLSVPVVVRRLGSSRSLSSSAEEKRGRACYLLLGDCYVQGIMHGELLEALGPEVAKTLWVVLSFR
ncbi:MAG: hypothetical protein Q9219_005544 [cf. Caloplaca sp. 3 TL-2023]